RVGDGFVDCPIRRLGRARSTYAGGTFMALFFPASTRALLNSRQHRQLAARYKTLVVERIEERAMMSAVPMHNSLPTPLSSHTPRPLRAWANRRTTMYDRSVSESLVP